MTKTCEERIDAHLKSTLETLRILWKQEQEDPDAYDKDLGNLNEYGLCFDYVEPNTFTDQQEGYYRYQLSWGGPSDEFRFWVSQYGCREPEVRIVEYWFRDWKDGAHRGLQGDDKALLTEIFHWFYPVVTV